MEKRLYRSKSNEVIGGVCGGLGDYFNIDPVIIRILAVLLAFANGFGILAYIVAWIIIPRKPLEVEEAELRAAEALAAKIGPGAPPRYNGWTKYLPGLALITLGLLMLVREFFYWFTWGDIFPALLILIGVIFLIASQKRRSEERTAYEEQANGVNGHNGGNGA